MSVPTRMVFLLKLDKYLEKLFVVHTSMCELEVAVTAQEVRKTVE